MAFFSFSTTSSFWRKILGSRRSWTRRPTRDDLVGIGGADAPLGRAQAVLAQVALGQPVELVVVGHDQVGVAADQELPRVDPLGRQRVHLGQQHGGVDDHAVADHRRDVVVEDAAGHQLKGEGLAVDDDGVPGVMTALIADDQLHVLGEQVGELALPFVAPLGPDDHGCGHASLLRCESGLRTSVPRMREVQLWIGPAALRS